MRLLPVLLLLPLFTLQAHVQTAASGAVTVAPDTPAATAPTTATPPHHRMTSQQRFAQANQAHDGHLTMQEATGGYPSIARHFTEIDADKKGYVTEEDIANWHKLQRAMHHHNTATDGLRPRPAMQRGTPAPQPMKTSTDGKLLPMTQTDGTTTATK